MTKFGMKRVLSCWAAGLLFLALGPNAFAQSSASDSFELTETHKFKALGEILTENPRALLKRLQHVLTKNEERQLQTQFRGMQNPLAIQIKKTKVLIYSKATDALTIRIPENKEGLLVNGHVIAPNLLRPVPDELDRIESLLFPKRAGLMNTILPTAHARSRFADLVVLGVYVSAATVSAWDKDPSLCSSQELQPGNRDIVSLLKSKQVTYDHYLADKCHVTNGKREALLDFECPGEFSAKSLSITKTRSGGGVEKLVADFERNDGKLTDQDSPEGSGQVESVSQMLKVTVLRGASLQSLEPSFKLHTKRSEGASGEYKVKPSSDEKEWKQVLKETSGNPQKIVVDVLKYQNLCSDIAMRNKLRQLIAEHRPEKVDPRLPASSENQ